MKVSIVMVMSLDGKTTLGDTPGTHPWASAEDQEFFQRMLAEHDCIVMGSNTFDAARAVIKPSADRPRVILTKAPERYVADAALPGLEFTSDSPADVLRKLERRGIENVVVAGGSVVNSSFIDAGLADEIFVTIEPLLFGAGLPLIAPLKDICPLKLLDVQKRNEQGTLLLHYQIVRSRNRHEDSEI